MSSQTPLFIVSSGRAGSTFLARLINMHPDIICISDLFEPVGSNPYFQEDHVVSGPDFFKILSRPSHKQRIAYWRRQPTDELLFLHDDDEMVSLLLSYTLPSLTEGNPMQLFCELERACEGFGLASMPDHLINLFEWLRDRFSKSLWVERTGGSLPHMEEIVNTWPTARIVHYYRDPRETAISMIKGDFFRLYLELLKNPELDKWDFEHIPPIQEMAAMLNRWIVDASDALDKVASERKTNMRYEDLIEKPQDTLLDLLHFIKEGRLSDTDIRWAEESSELVRKPPMRFPRLSNKDREALVGACREGVEILGYD